MKNKLKNLPVSYQQTKFKDCLKNIDSTTYFDIDINNINIAELYKQIEKEFKFFKDCGYYCFKKTLIDNDEHYFIFNLIDIKEEELNSIKMNDKIIKNITLMENVFINIDIIKNFMLLLKNDNYYVLLVFKKIKAL